MSLCPVQKLIGGFSAKARPFLDSRNHLHGNRLQMTLVREGEFWLKNEVVWQKNKGSGPKK